MKRLFGSLCLVTFIATSAVYFSFQPPVEGKDQTSLAPISQAVGPGRPYNIFGLRKAETKATKMVAVTSSGCPPCRRLKLYTIPVLMAENYDVTVVTAESWNKTNPKFKVKSVPTLVYMNEKMKVLRMEVGFKTPEQVKKYLTK